LWRSHQLVTDGTYTFFDFSLNAAQTPHLARLFARQFELAATGGQPAKFNTIYKKRMPSIPVLQTLVVINHSQFLNLKPQISNLK
jgi:hypothetical protein